MRRTIHLKLVLVLLGIGALLAGAVYALHRWQVGRTAHHLLELADRAAAEASDSKADVATREKADIKAETYYAQYLAMVPGDIAAIKSYAQVLDRRATPARRDEVVARMEEVLRAWPDEHALRMRLAENLRIVDRLPDAIAHLKKLLPHWDDKAEIHHILGWYEELRFEDAAAAASLREAIRLDPHRLPPYTRLTMVLQDRLKKPDDALAVMEEMVSKNPESWEAYLLRSRFHRGRSKQDLADADLRKALELGANRAEVTFEAASVEVSRAESAALEKRYDQARQVLDRARTKYPGEILVVTALIDLALMQGQWTEAEKLLGQANEVKEFAARVELPLARARLWSQRRSADDLRQLASLSEKALKGPAGPNRIRLAQALGDTWYRLGDWQRAERFWRMQAQDLPRDLGVRLHLLELALLKDDVATARRWHTEIRRIEGEQGPLARFGAAALLVKEAQGDRTRLESARKLIKDLRPDYDSPRLALLSATIFEMEGQHQQAIAEYSRALAQGELDARAMARLLELLIDRREFGKAEVELSKYTRKQPLTKELARLGTEVALGAGDRQAKEAVLTRAAVAAPLPSRDYRDYLWLSRVHQAVADHDEAEKFARTAIELAPHVAETWLALIEHLERAGDHPQAMKELERLKQALPVARQPLAIARGYEVLRLHEKASQAYEEALRARPHEPALLAAAAEFHRRADQDEMARSLYARLLKPELAASPSVTVPARRQYAILLGRLGDTTSRSRALALLDEIAQARGDTVADQRIRLFVRSQADADRKTSLEQFQESIQRQRPTPDEQLLLAQMLEAAGQRVQARSQLREVVEQHPKDAQYLARYVGILVRLEEWDEARQLLDRLEGLEPASSRVRDLKAALAASSQ